MTTTSGRRSFVLLCASFLLSCGGERKPSPEVVEEVDRREAYAHSLLRDAGAEALRMSSTEDIVFREGFSLIQLEPAEKFNGGAYRWMSGRGRIRLRVRDPNTPTRLRFAFWIVEQVVHTKVRVHFYVDGQYVGSTLFADEHGVLFSDTTIDPIYLRGREWVDLTLEPSSIGFHWMDVPEHRWVKLFNFEWGNSAR
jgi:hypothetical protein